MRIGLVGDLLLARRFDASRSGLRRVFDGCDAVFGNLECVLHNFEDPPARPSGGTWTRADPDVAKDLRALGLNVVSMANNHAGDYGAGAARSTVAHLQVANISSAGWGEDLTSAASPAILDSYGGSVAVVAGTSTFPEHSMAAYPKGRIRARPGVNPLRIDYTLHMPDGDLSKAQRLLGALGVARRTTTGDMILFGRHRVTAGESYGYRASARASDLQRLIDGIRSATDSALVLVSHHVHPGRGSLEEEPDEAQEAIAKAAIDAGASIVAGHGAHTLRPVEFYGDGVIFYGLGSLFLESAWTRDAPWDACDQQDGDRRIGSQSARAHESSRWGLMVLADVSARRVERVQAVLVSLRAGRPRIVSPEMATRMVDHLRRLSEPRGTVLRTAGTRLELLRRYSQLQDG